MHISNDIGVPVLAIEFSDGGELELRHDDEVLVAVVTERSVWITDCLEGEGRRCSRG